MTRFFRRSTCRGLVGLLSFTFLFSALAVDPPPSKTKKPAANQTTRPAARSGTSKPAPPAQTPSAPSAGGKTPSAAPATSQLDRMVLENGMTVLLLPIPGADKVAVETIYKVGFLHEPETMTQASHLLEHLALRAATSTFKENEFFKTLEQRGIVNAETLPHITHFDYIVPPTDLELVCRFEADRLRGIKITPELVKAEAAKCYAETAMVESNPQAGLLKHAFMAFNQSWRYEAPFAPVRGGLESIPIDQLQSFYRAAYQPANGLLVLAGGFDKAQAVALLKRTVGSVPVPKEQALRPIDWSNVVQQKTIRWDTKVKAMVAAFPPPTNSFDRLVMNLWGTLLLQTLARDQELLQNCDFIYSTSQSWTTGLLPFFMYVALKPNAPGAVVQRQLIDRTEMLQTYIPVAKDIVQLQALITELTASPQVEWSLVQKQSGLLAERLKQPPEKALSLFLGNLALQLGMRELLFEGITPQDMQRIARLNSSEVQKVVFKVLDPGARILTGLLPVELEQKK
jgi:predicted Zn-dependent peptidase